VAAVPFVGPSATPWAKGLGKYYDDLIVAATTADLIDAGYLSRFVVYAPSTPDLVGVHIVAGEFNQQEPAARCNTVELVGDVIDTWLSKGERRPTLCYGVDRTHAEHLQQRFIEVGTAAEYIDCFTKAEQREAIFARFRSGEVRVICNVGTLTTGIDLDVRCIIDAHPTKSEILFVQTIGRGLRTAAGKENLIILDHAGNHLRLGMATDIRHELLDDGKSKKPSSSSERDTSLPKRCKACTCLLTPQEKACPQCGAPVETRCGVVAKEGELVELGARQSGIAKGPDIVEKSPSWASFEALPRNVDIRRDGLLTNSKRSSAIGLTIHASNSRR
jgi:DNA repair protein RadD